MNDRERYNPQGIEPRWQQMWLESKMYFVEPRDDKPKFYTLVMFPYPSGDLHMGHMRNYTIGDLVARYRTMQGYNVMNPMGWDAFGLPAENAAIKEGVHPAVRTLDNIERMKEQFFKMGIVYDWSREVASCLPDYYRWTQWMFLLMYERGLAYRKKAPANWCPNDQTVLANEQVLPDGTCERCGAPVTKKDLTQWFFRITQYADRLLDDLDMLQEWPDRVRTMQRNWIGRSTGAEIAFQVEGSGAGNREPGIGSRGLGTEDRGPRTDPVIRVFTTRPDTVFGATFMVVAPEHPLVPVLTTAEHQGEVQEYIEQAKRKSEIERQSTDKEKTGVFTGGYATNPMTGEPIPVWIADYVLMTYGTGAIMAVPGSDERDYDFAVKYGLPIVTVLQWPEDAPSGGKDGSAGPVQKEGASVPLYYGPGTIVNSRPLNGVPTTESVTAAVALLEAEGKGRGTTIFRLRDWLISRQRYWGPPIPIVYCPECGEVPVPAEQLPVILPTDVEFRPGGESPLGRVESFVRTTCPRCGGEATRETDTMDTFVDSSWYFLRFCDPHNDKEPFSREKANHWMAVDQYTGGVEHAILHLMYARFVTKVLADAGMVGVQEPFMRLFTQGMITKDGAKMSKSKGNVVPVDEMTERYGADTGRLFVLFIGPPDEDAEWTDDGASGMFRFLNRVWRLYEGRVTLAAPAGSGHATIDYSRSDRELLRKVHLTIRKVTQDIERFHFNTAVSAIMELVNTMHSYRDAHGPETTPYSEAATSLLLLLAPMAPHITEELWNRAGGEGSVHTQPWPTHSAELAAAEVVTLAIQVNGKVRDRVEVPADVTQEEATQAALTSEKVKPYLDGKEIRQVHYVPGRLVSIVL